MKRVKNQEIKSTSIIDVPFQSRAKKSYISTMALSPLRLLHRSLRFYLVLNETLFLLKEKPIELTHVKVSRY